MNREEIKNILPHREPMLLLDSLGLEEGCAVGRYAFRGDEWFFGGHYPGNPVVPGVIQLEIMAQTCSLLFLDDLKGNTPYYAGVDKARFRRMVKPGETIEVRAEKTNHKGTFYFADCKAYAAGELCATASLVFALVKGR